MTETACSTFEIQDHANYFLSCLRSLHHAYSSLDTTRLTVVYFSVVGLDMLGKLQEVERTHIIDYIYGMQIGLDTNGRNIQCQECSNPYIEGAGGFLGSSCAGQPFRTYNERNSSREPKTSIGIDDCISGFASYSANSEKMCGCISFEYLQSHLAMAYTAVATLLTLEDDLSRLDKHALIHSIRCAQLSSGAFRATKTGTEADMRFVYCACAISYMLGDWSGVDKNRVVEYVRKCITYEGGMSLIPGGEAQGGATFCAVASLVLMDKLEDIGAASKQALVFWCEQRVQTEGGYNGRTNKDPDSCYSFWVGATLEMLGCFNNTDAEPAQKFLLNECQYSKYMGRVGIGGFSKTPGCQPDILHTFYSIAWLSMATSRTNRSNDSGQVQLYNLRPLFTPLAVCREIVAAASM